MATNFVIKDMSPTRAIIRLPHDGKLIDCRFPDGMAEEERMPWLKQTANEYLTNTGRDDLIDLDPATEPIYDTNEDGVEETPAESPSWWQRLFGG